MNAPRSNPEWIGKTPDEPFPVRVRIRIFNACGGCCRRCGRAIRGRLRAPFDHFVALFNGRENRESNGQLLCSECHDLKTKDDIAEKATVYRKQVKHLGIKKRKGRPMLGSKDSGWKKTFYHGWVKR